MRMKVKMKRNDVEMRSSWTGLWTTSGDGDGGGGGSDGGGGGWDLIGRQDW